MAGLLDYYNQNPELFAQNEYLLAKDPAYDLGMMDLGAMSFQERPGGEWYSPPKILGMELPSDRDPYEPLSGVMGSYLHPGVDVEDMPRGMKKLNMTPGEISLYTGPFTEGDMPTYWDDPNIGPPTEREQKPISNLDKARIIAHENRHKLTEENPELYNLQPNWTALNVQSDDPDAEKSLFRKIFGIPSIAEGRAARISHWRNEIFNRYMDLRNFPDFPWGGNKRFPSGMSAGKIEPTDMYFDKILRDKWEPSAKAYDEKVKEIAERKKPPRRTAPIHSPHGGGPGTGVGGGGNAGGAQLASGMTTGQHAAFRMAHGGLIDIPLPGRSRDI